MPRGYNKTTLDRIIQAKADQPYNLGPLLGELALRAALSPSMIATILGVTHSTVFRWVFGESTPHSIHHEKIGRLLGVLTWGLEKEYFPLAGNGSQKTKQFRQILTSYRSEIRSVAKGAETQI